VAVGGSGVPAIVEAGEKAPEDKERAVEVVVHAAERGKGRSDKNAVAMELHRPSMVDTAVRRRGGEEEDREGEASEEEEWGAVSGLSKTREGAAAAGRGSATRGSNGGGAAGAWRTRRHSIEHVACGETSKVGR
jgi:hypothetical protein